MPLESDLILRLMKCKPDSTIKDCIRTSETGLNWMEKEKRIKDTANYIEMVNSKENSHYDERNI